MKRLIAFPNEQVRIYSNGDLKVKLKGSEKFIPIQSLDKQFEKIFTEGYRGYQKGY